MSPPTQTPFAQTQGARILAFPRAPAATDTLSPPMADLRAAVAELRAALDKLAANTGSLESSLKIYQGALTGLDRQVRALNGTARQMAAIAGRAASR